MPYILSIRRSCIPIYAFGIYLQGGAERGGDAAQPRSFGYNKWDSVPFPILLACLITHPFQWGNRAQGIGPGSVHQACSKLLLPASWLSLRLLYHHPTLFARKAPLVCSCFAIGLCGSPLFAYLVLILFFLGCSMLSCFILRYVVLVLFGHHAG